MMRKAQLISENKKLKRKVFVFENIGVGLNSSIKEKEVAVKNFLNANPEYNAYEVCTFINLNRGTFFNFINYGVIKPWYEKREEIITREIIDIFEESNKTYGIERINIVLRQRGLNVSLKKISEIMKKNNLIKINIIKRPRKQSERPIRNYKENILNRNFNPDSPNKVWVSDFLEIKVKEARFYLCVILDLYARKVVAWRLSHNRNENLILNTFKDAYEFRGEPANLLFHSDQGSEFKSNVFMDTLQMLGVTQSFSYPGSPNDNSPMESFYRTVRVEETNPHIDNYENSLIIREYLTNYFDFYNDRRVHTSNGGLTPNEKEEKYYSDNYV